ncbi:DNA-protecting protein DprA [Candidatus Pacearchaeota archaeon]|nr:DNA-protecting protein DprA [Candidatus Pacearchaeota archaeon]
MKIYDFILSKIAGNSGALMDILLKKFKTSKKILYVSNDDITLHLSLEKIRDEDILEFLERRQEFLKDKSRYIDKCKEEIDCLKNKYNIYIISISDSNYPKQLRSIKDVPLNLYVKGKIDFNFLKSIAIVGSRNTSSYAREKVSEISKDLSKEGFCIISGLARGIDGQAQSSAIASGGKTIAVLPFLSDKIYPPEHSNLAKDILINGGAIISENFLLKKTYNPVLFTERNRLISGLSRAVLIAEGSIPSGSLSQYNHAKNQKKIMFTLKPIKEHEGTLLPEKIMSEGGFGINSSKEIIEILNKLGYQKKLYEIT